eukprot:4242857-Amphidinium_carterae.1
MDNIIVQPRWQYEDEVAKGLPVSGASGSLIDNQSSRRSTGSSWSGKRSTITKKRQAQIKRKRKPSARCGKTREV